MSSSYHRPELRADLLAATRALVEAEGTHAVTIARVARACDVSVAAPYRHFANKAALLGAVAADGYAALGSEMAAAAGRAGSPADRLVAAGVAYVGFAIAHPDLFALMFDRDLRDPHPAAHAVLEGLAALIDSQDLAVPPEVALRDAWALAHGLATLRIGGMATFTRDDSPARLERDLRGLLSGILR
ncbi:TetR/AcrR family transcriptional regulator [Propioniciclava coleopterorum]|uniref:TetR/AcrR family transcriptional regulator n=1 Tax=Propioniciclava coleopterorum TaxID=2714937 RepID=A0A6G7YA27_9ACTN|nr:TetR/AcrR family transcriptional regulator [Propioniciclava coleopterorum]QIK73655.1 TetR/AcrR family transcriptional regulator [Propioniciclava coleopterorum]